MTTPYMTADFRLRSHKRSAKVFLSNLFTVEVVDFDGETREYSVSAERSTLVALLAKNFEEAAREAESLAYSEGIQISFMNINAF